MNMRLGIVNIIKILDAKMISVIRDPRAAISGSFRGYKRTEVLSLSQIRNDF